MRSIRVGLTGSIGAGKSWAARFFRLHGACVIDADQVSHDLTKKGSEGYNEIIKSFGSDYLLEDGTIDRPKLARHVFSNPNERLKLNNLMHPLILKEMVTMAESSNEKLIVFDIPLLAEAPDFLRELLGIDVIIAIDALEEVRLSRLVNLRGYTEEEALRRMRSQMPREDQIKIADIVIENNSSLDNFNLSLESALNDLASSYRK